MATPQGLVDDRGFPYAIMEPLVQAAAPYVNHEGHDHVAPVDIALAEQPSQLRAESNINQEAAPYNIAAAEQTLQQRVLPAGCRNWQGENVPCLSTTTMHPPIQQGLGY